MSRSPVKLEYKESKPSVIIWNDGRRFDIKNILYECEYIPKCFRYTVLVGNNTERYLYVTPNESYIGTE